MIAIKGTEMPSCCVECFFYSESDGFCRRLGISKWEKYIKEINHSDNDWKYVERANICPLVEIPDNETNGDMFMTMFPNIIIEIRDNTVYTNIDNECWFSLDWWNAPYKNERGK